MTTKRSTEYQCPICKLMYMYKGGVESHIKLKHSPDENPTKKEKSNE